MAASAEQRAGYGVGCADLKGMGVRLTLSHRTPKVTDSVCVLSSQFFM